MMCMGQCGCCNLKFVQGSLTAANTVSLPDPLTDFYNENLYPDVEKNQYNYLSIVVKLEDVSNFKRENNQINRLITVQVGGQGHHRCFINSKSMIFKQVITMELVSHTVCFRD